MEGIIKLLQKGVVNFVYKKKDGSIRKAIGTLKDIEVKFKRPDIIPYFDLEKKGFRSFKLDNLKEINGKAFKGGN